jgi:hypothetical protein
MSTIVPEYRIKHFFPKKRLKTLLSRGVDYNTILRKGTVLDVEKALTKMEPGERMPHKPISVNKQLNAFDSIIENPLRGSYVVGIGSVATDLAAKQVALTIMNSAIRTYLFSTLYQKRDLPLWHKVYGSWADNLRDSYKDNPAMLIISNLAENSTNIKFEKTRDLLEKFSDIPRIVIVGGQNPATFFCRKTSLSHEGRFLFDR